MRLLAQKGAILACFKLHIKTVGNSQPTLPSGNDFNTTICLRAGTVGPGFKSQPRRCRVTVLGTVHTHRASVHQAAKLVAALLRVVGVTAGLVQSNGNLPRRVYDSRYLQADCQEPGSVPEPYAWRSSMGYLYLSETIGYKHKLSRLS